MSMRYDIAEILGKDDDLIARASTRGDTPYVTLSRVETPQYFSLYLEEAEELSEFLQQFLQEVRTQELDE